MIFILMISIGLIGANSLVLSPIAAEVAAGLSVANPADVMAASAAYGGGVAISALLLAPMADKFGADTALRQSMVLIVAAIAISACAPNSTVLIIAQALAGIGAGMALPAIYSLATLIAPKGQEARTIGKVLTGWTLSMVGGVTLSAFIADSFGWRAVYGALSLGLAAVLITLYYVTLPQAPKSAKATSPISALKVQGLLPGLFSVCMLGTAFYGVYNYLGTHITEDLGRSISAGGWFTLSYGLGFAAAMLFDPMLDRIGARRGLIAVFALTSLYLVFMASLAYSYLWLCLSMFGWGALQHLGLNLTVGRLSMLDASQRGAIMGLNSAVMYVSVFAATLLYRPIFDGWGLAVCMLLSAVLMAFGCLEALVARQRAKLVQP
ncbi:MFS transporter [Cognatishimia sp. WU-CL00825]|uniref:MFS transporter n=1 Tax=Cognatishimia sp. WU-CL00825 TaxID=3127658 RepID=UPI0031085DC5